MVRSQHITLSCVVPVYNEATHLPAFIAHLHQALAPLVAAIEIVVVNDGSVDHTDEVIKPCLEQYPIRYLSFSRNFGKEVALSAGLDHASGDVVLLIDADFQHPVELVKEMLALWHNGYDMIYGVIGNRQHESLVKRLGTSAFYKLINANSANRFVIPQNAGDFRLMDRKVVEVLKQLPERKRFMKGLYAWVGFKTAALPFTPDQRASGSSHYNLRRLASLASTGLTSFSSIPLRVSAIVGALISGFTLIYALFLFIDTLVFGNDVPGWTTIAVSLMLFSGIQLILLGIMGEYIGQIYEEIKHRPMYVIDQDLKSNPTPSDETQSYETQAAQHNNEKTDDDATPYIDQP